MRTSKVGKIGFLISECALILFLVINAIKMITKQFEGKYVWLTLLTAILIFLISNKKIYQGRYINTEANISLSEESIQINQYSNGRE